MTITYRNQPYTRPITVGCEAGVATRRVGPGRPRGEAHFRAKASDGDVILARELHREGLSYREIGRKFEAAPSTIRAWITCERRMMSPAREAQVRSTLCL